jgi:hypothetical protein
MSYNRFERGISIGKNGGGMNPQESMSKHVIKKI